jgi:uncharacterized protein (DUF2225 family)
MTTLQPFKLTCPLCGNIFESPIVTSTNSFGKLHSDLYKEAEGEQPVCYFIHSCNDCGYSGFEGDFEPQDFDHEFRARVQEVITPEVKSQKIDTYGNFYLAALCAEWRGAPPYVLARIYHMGAWCYRVRGDKDKEMFYLIEAASNFERALRQSDTPKENRAVYTYLIGDIYRRLDVQDRAKEWYGKVEQAIKEYGGDPKFGEFARKQLTDPSDYL